MSVVGIGEILVIAALVVLPCLGILITAGIVVAVIALTRKNREKFDKR